MSQLSAAAFKSPTPGRDRHRPAVVATAIALFLCGIASQLPAVRGHTWLFTHGRAAMEASLDFPFRARKLQGGQGTHAQLGPEQEMVVRWASSHNNTFSFVVVSAQDQEIFFDPEFYTYVKDYIDNAPAGSNVAVERPRYHGTANRAQSVYISNANTYEVCAGGFCVDRLFSRKMAPTDPGFVDHFDDMSGGGNLRYSTQYEYNANLITDDRRVSYRSTDHPWLIAAYSYHNKANMHSDWDLVSMDLPASVFNPATITEKGQHYMVHFSSRSSTDYTYTDVIDVNVHPTAVPEELKYGGTTGDFGWVKVDHCQFIEPVNLLSPVRNATDDAVACQGDMEAYGIVGGSKYYNKPLGINVVPATNPEVVPGSVFREAEPVSSTCTGACISVNSVPTAGFCRAPTATDGASVCSAPARLHTVVWANPLVSNAPYGADTVTGAKAGDVIEWTWDDVIHDVYLMASAEAAEACDFTGATELIPPSHHATFDPTTNVVVPGRNQWVIPEGAVGVTLSFACSVSSHCADGAQRFEIEVGDTPAVPDPASDAGVCPDGFELCPDDSQQTETTVEFETQVNVPWTDSRTAASLRLYGNASRAATPWHLWAHRRFDGMVCASRPESSLSFSYFVDYKRPVWDLVNFTLREALDACSSNHPEICTGIAFRNISYDTINVPEDARAYSGSYSSLARYADSALGASGWVVQYSTRVPGRAWMQMDLGAMRQVAGVVTQSRAGSGQSVTSYTVQYSSDGVNFTDVPGFLLGPRGPALDIPRAPPAGTESVVAGLQMTVAGIAYESSAHSTRMGVYVVLIRLERNATVTTRCIGCNLLFSNGNGGSFRVTGVLHWSWDGQWLYGCLPDGQTSDDVNAAISVGDTLTVTDLASDGSGMTPANEQVEAVLPEVVAARYIRLRPESWIGGDVAMRAGLLVLKADTGLHTGRHEFRRCLVSDGYTKLVNVGASSTPTKSVGCPGCYECREVVNPPGRRLGYWGPYTRHLRRGFDLTLTEPGTGSTVLTAKLPEPVSNDVPEDGGNARRLTWDVHELDVLCRIDPAFSAPMPPDLEPDEDWVTFITPTASDSPLEAIAAGFSPLAAATAFRNEGMVNLAAVYPPGAQVNPVVTAGPYSTQNYSDLLHSERFQGGTPQSYGGADAVWWPPKPSVKVTFQPRGPACTNYAHPSCGMTNPDRVAGWLVESETAGWHVDHGDDYGAKSNNVTGATAEYGWRCAPIMQWYGHGWSNAADYEWPPFAWGIVNRLGEHRTADGIMYPVCPDGLPNTWEIAVPNGLYMVHVGHANNFGQPTWDGCTYENIRTTSRGHHWMNMPQTLKDVGGVVQHTEVLTAEILDGKFTLSNSIGKCGNINWIKLDLITPTAYPAPWLPSPEREWWQLALEDPAAPVGLVQIMLPHERSKTFESFPQQEESHAPDCRGWWLYAPAKCYHMMMLGQKRGVHPDLGAYPEFPGYTASFAEWLFEQHDTNGDGSITFEEFVGNTATDAYGWNLLTQHGQFQTRGIGHADNLARFFKKIDIEAAAHDRHVNDHGDGVVSRAEWVNGILARPRTDFCDAYEDSVYTHNSWNDEFCTKHRNVIPQQWSNFSNDGQHGFVVMVSDFPCTDADGCLPTNSSNVTVCEGIQLAPEYESQIDVRRNSVNTHAMPPSVDCGGATGAYLQVFLPGRGRIFSANEVRVHRARLPGPSAAPLRTKPRKQMACYGLEARQPPEATDPNVLAEAKNHPYHTVTDNPEDPIFYSTCYLRAIIKEWLPLGGDGDASQSTNAPWSFANGTHCLDCLSHARTSSAENGVAYNVTTMHTPQWWLQPAGECCTDCDTGQPSALCATPGTVAVGDTTTPTQVVNGAGDIDSSTATDDEGMSTGTLVAIVIVTLILLTLIVAFAVVRRRNPGATEPSIAGSHLPRKPRLSMNPVFVPVSPTDAPAGAARTPPPSPAVRSQSAIPLSSLPAPQAGRRHTVQAVTATSADGLPILLASQPVGGSLRGKRTAVPGHGKFYL